MSKQAGPIGGWAKSLFSVVLSPQSVKTGSGAIEENTATICAGSPFPLFSFFFPFDSLLPPLFLLPVTTVSEKHRNGNARASPSPLFFPSPLDSFLFSLFCSVTSLDYEPWEKVQGRLKAGLQTEAFVFLPFSPPSSFSPSLLLLPGVSQVV